ncbi:MAG: hypothetical protein BM556_15165 [Bacteriovorax sp. MedPE-SWde]|nr:MAG: hypothetical protein BM556_15165 [Bacteriovorax sp. MedPE-SWde]
MKLKFLYIFLLLCHCVNAREIVVSLTHFPPYVDKTIAGHGIYPKYISKFFKEQGHTVKFNFVPYARILKNIEDTSHRGFTVLSKRTMSQMSHNQSLYKSTIFDEVNYCTFYKKSKFPSGVPYEGGNGIRGLPMIVFLKGPINKYLKKFKNKTFKVTSFEGAMKMLDKERASIFVSAEVIGRYYIDKLGLTEKIGCSPFPLEEHVMIVTPNKNLAKKFLKPLNRYIKRKNGKQ